MNKICLMGASFETGNRGVSALAASLIKNIHEIKPNAEICFLIGNRMPKTYSLEIYDKKIQIGVINYRLSPKAKIKEHLLWIFFLALSQRLVPFKFISKLIIQSNAYLKTLDEADFVGDIQGGDSFSDIYGLFRFIVQAMPDIIVLLMNKKLILLPQTYGPYNHFIARQFAQYIIRRSYKAFSRDKESIELLSKLLKEQGNGKGVIFCPDVAFTLDSVKLNTLHIKPSINPSLSAPLIGININGLMYNGGYTRENMFGLKLDYKSFVYKLAVSILEKTNSHILFVPHTFGTEGNINSDPDACQNVLKSLSDSYKDRIHIVMKEYDQSEIKGIIGLCDFFIGSRMHACIASLSQGIPTVGVAYSKKFKGVFESVGVKDMVVDGRYSDTEAAIERIFQCFESREEIKAVLQEKVDFAKMQIRKTFEEILLT